MRIIGGVLGVLVVIFGLLALFGFVKRGWISYVGGIALVGTGIYLLNYAITGRSTIGQYSTDASGRSDTSSID